MILIIGGHNASGKTLLRKLCNSHPEVEITEEFYSFYQLNVSVKRHIQGLRKSWYKYPLVGEHEAPKFERHLRNVVFLTRYLVALQPYRRVLIRAEDVEGILHRIFPQASVVGDAGFRYLFYVLDNSICIPNLFPAIIYRDCRDVAGDIAFRRRFGSWGHDVWANENFGTAEQVARKWMYGIELMERYADQIYKIRYEDLVTKPHTVMTELSKLLDVDSEGFAHHIVHTNKVGSYKQWLSGEEVATILSIAGPTLERLGYHI